MLTLMTGNILASDAECLVNTVNCEGFMGKGLAYQFKKKFPETNKSYIKACNRNELYPGKMHYFKENGKLIVNFPTKNKWREKSKIEYITDGMTALINLIKEKDIKSIAIPPLGSGNGGLNWEEVKKIILKMIDPIMNDVEVYIYEPSFSYKTEAHKAPKLTTSHLILMNIKKNSEDFSKLNLQKAAYFVNIFSHKDYFNFAPHHFGPYSHTISILSRDIKEFQEYHKINTNEAIELAKKTLISKKIEKELKDFVSPIEKATKLINSYSSGKDIELISTICYIIQKNPNIHEDQIISKLHDWSELKKEKFSSQLISNQISNLIAKNVIIRDILGEYNLI